MARMSAGQVKKVTWWDEFTDSPSGALLALVVFLSVAVGIGLGIGLIIGWAGFLAAHLL